MMHAMAKRKRAGRPRNVDAERQPDGRAKPKLVGPSKETLDRRIEALSVIVAQYPQRFAAPLAIDPDAGWHIGRLYLVGAITQRQKDAAVRYRKVVATYESMLGAPKRPQALDMNRIAGTVNEDEDRLTKRFRRAKRQYEAMHDALSQHGRDVVRAVTGALRDEQVRMDWLRKGLDALDEV